MKPGLVSPSPFLALPPPSGSTLSPSLPMAAHRSGRNILGRSFSVTTRARRVSLSTLSPPFPFPFPFPWVPGPSGQLAGSLKRNQISQVPPKFDSRVAIRDPRTFW
ncbi:hypothetical protein GY45DRAFT_1320957 [Cubamyces sp. BRFM 1775]|nr:hypothetical protein GY45DRAFT_1320957 [Cubamyces sp. BRFM 1775]